MGSGPSQTVAFVARYLLAATTKGIRLLYLVVATRPFFYDLFHRLKRFLREPRNDRIVKRRHH